MSKWHIGDWNIGDQVIDEDGCKGRVVIYYEDGDVCEHENDSAHPNPRLWEEHEAKIKT